MIYDCFLFYNELELLEIRLNELKDSVDKHVLVESTITFQHKQKELVFQKNKDLFKDFLHKIIHVVIDDSPTDSTWETEIFQREGIRRGLIDCKEDDLIIIADLDEIPSPFAINIYNDSPIKQIRAFKQLFTYYYVNCVINSNWSHAKILPYKLFKEYSSIQKIRDEKAESLFRGGWHFSYLGGVEKVIDKITSFSHTELNNSYYTDPERLKECMEKGIDFIMPRQFKFVELNNTYPKYLMDNLDKFQHLIKA